MTLFPSLSSPTHGLVAAILLLASDQQTSILTSRFSESTTTPPHIYIYMPVSDYTPSPPQHTVLMLFVFTLCIVYIVYYVQCIVYTVY